MTNYEAAREKYAALGVDTDKAIETLKKVPVSLHCWQLDDVIGFDNDGGLTGGIQTTGNYMGRARTPEQLMADMEEAMRLMPGTAKLNIHASYAIFAPGEFADRDALEPKHFAKWVEFAKKHHMGIDFNPTFFSHEKVKDGQTLSSPDEETRRFWINHGKACIRISEYFAKETGMPCVMNIWTGDGFKDVPADRMGPRMRYKDSIEQILSEPYDHNLVKPCVESKVFGIGVEEFSGTDGNKKRSIGPIADAARFTIPPFSAIFISPTQNAMAPVIVRQRLTASFAEASAWSVTAPRFPVIAAYTTPTRIIPPHK